MILWAIAHPIPAALIVGALVVAFGWLVAAISYQEGRYHEAEDQWRDGYAKGRADALPEKYKRAGTAGRAQWQ